MNEEDAITATLVPEDRRLDFLPKHFEDYLMVGEATVFAWASTLSRDYANGLWNFFDLSNGGFFMAPCSPQTLHIEWPDNHFEGELSADAAGIVITLFALNHLAHRFQDRDFVGQWEALRDYAQSHPESALIYAAIDYSSSGAGRKTG